MVDALADGRGPVPAELRWEQEHGGKFHERNRVLLTAYRDHRVFFQNRLTTAVPVGTELGGERLGPLRRREPNGEESMDVAFFGVLFSLDGRALLQT